MILKQLIPRVLCNKFIVKVTFEACNTQEAVAPSQHD